MRLEKITPAYGGRPAGVDIKAVARDGNTYSTVTDSRAARGKKLVIFALGWGSNPAVVEHIMPSGFDKWVLYDYRTVETVPQAELAGYDNIWLFAWSFGVWAAEQIFTHIEFRRAVALCGSPFPVNDNYGIPVRAFEVTLKGIAGGGDEKFNLRTYGEYYENMREAIAERPWPERLEELETLYRESSNVYEPSLKWTDAVIGSRDVIFPEHNLRNHWGAEAMVVDAPHYPFGNEKLIYDILNETR